MTRKHEPAWRAVAARCGGEVLEGGRGKVEALRFAHEAWLIMLGTFVVSTGKTSATYTRARALVNEAADLRFKLSPENAFTRLGKMLGMQDVHAGHPDLDRRFIIKGNNESMIRSLLVDSRVYHPLLSLGAVSFELVRFRGRIGNRPRNVAELRAQTLGLLAEEAPLRHMVDLLRASLDQLARMGAINAAAVDYPL